MVRYAIMVLATLVALMALCMPTNAQNIPTNPTPKQQGTQVIPIETPEPEKVKVNDYRCPMVVSDNLTKLTYQNCFWLNYPTEVVVSWTDKNYFWIGIAREDDDKVFYMTSAKVWSIQPIPFKVDGENVFLEVHYTDSKFGMEFSFLGDNWDFKFNTEVLPNCPDTSAYSDITFPSCWIIDDVTVLFQWHDSEGWYSGFDTITDTTNTSYEGSWYSNGPQAILIVSKYILIVSTSEGYDGFGLRAYKVLPKALTTGEDAYLMDWQVAVDKNGEIGFSSLSVSDPAIIYQLP